MVDYKQSFKKRTVKGANIAETACVKFLNQQKNFHWYKMGFDEADRNIPFQYFVKVPEILRNIPDYVCIKKKSFFLECKGYRDYLKIKENDIMSYNFWNDIMDLYFYFYDCGKQKQLIMSYTKLLDTIDISETGRYPDNNKLYYKIKL